MLCRFLSFFSRQFRANPLLFLRRKKLRLSGTIRKQQVCKEPAHYCWKTLQYKEPSPTAESEPVCVIQYKPGNRSTYDTGNRSGGHEHCNCLCLFALTKPVRQVKHNAGEITRFSQPQ